MRKLTGRIILVLLLLVVFDQTMGELLDYLKDHAPDGRYYKARYSLEQCNEDVIILGSSRGEMNYDPFIIEDSLKMTCWDASRGGEGMAYFRSMQEGILARYAPKLVILNVEGNMLEDLPSYVENGFLRPFYKDHQEIRPFIKKISRFEKYLMLSRLYAYNSSFYYLIRPYFIKGLDGSRDDKGWKPRDGHINEVFVHKGIEVVKDDKSLNQETVAEFRNLVRRFEEKGTRLVFVVSPNYGVYEKETPTIRYIQEFSKDHDIPFLIHSNDTAIITHDEYFIDPDHLNREGAIYFTQKIVSEIKSQFRGVSFHEETSKTWTGI